MDDDTDRKSLATTCHLVRTRRRCIRGLEQSVFSNLAQFILLISSKTGLTVQLLFSNLIIPLNGRSGLRQKFQASERQLCFLPAELASVGIEADKPDSIVSSPGSSWISPFSQWRAIFLRSPKLIIFCRDYLLNIKTRHDRTSTKMSNACEWMNVGCSHSRSG